MKIVQINKCPVIFLKLTNDKFTLLFTSLRVIACLLYGLTCFHWLRNYVSTNHTLSHNTRQLTNQPSVSQGSCLLMVLLIPLVNTPLKYWPYTVTRHGEVTNPDSTAFLSKSLAFHGDSLLRSNITKRNSSTICKRWPLESTQVATIHVTILINKTTASDNWYLGSNGTSVISMLSIRWSHCSGHEVWYCYHRPTSSRCLITSLSGWP